MQAVTFFQIGDGEDKNSWKRLTELNTAHENMRYVYSLNDIKYRLAHRGIKSLPSVVVTRNLMLFAKTIQQNSNNKVE